MAEIKIYNLGGKEIGKMRVSDKVFSLIANDDLVHQIAVSEMANRRQVLAHTKTRGERAGSGRKPWRQKGTGRARVGSVRTPIWRKGGIVFGPRADRNFKQKINKKMNAKAIATVLSGKLRDKEIYVVEKLELSDKKTREMARILNKLKLAGKTLISFSDKEKELRITGRNIKNAENILTSQLNVLDMLNSRNLLMSKESIEYLEKKLGKK